MLRGGGGGGGGGAGGGGGGDTKLESSEAALKAKMAGIMEAYTKAEDA